MKITASPLPSQSPCASLDVSCCLFLQFACAPIHSPCSTSCFPTLNALLPCEMNSFFFLPGGGWTTLLLFSVSESSSFKKMNAPCVLQVAAGSSSKKMNSLSPSALHSLLNERRSSQAAAAPLF
ncbi:hypothetical protein VIGAN_05212900 [Vigna angularis var. angularis]|uniref:Uncharacterized protein n=1 Tax=Vigna angularis var. angularis TaxID=157739 RepID=A0A0S3S6X1_PHAAN|nr:hypothetical protein VIGAN_05212900 [Vigna angularis var. angularis]